MIEIIRFPYRENADKFGQMFVTLDSHHRTHIAHSASWNSKADGSGESPSPFTLITHDDVMNGRWFPTNPSLQVIATFPTY